MRYERLGETLRASRPDADAIPFVDLAAQHRELEGELVAAFRSALSTVGFVGGPEVTAFGDGVRSIHRHAELRRGRKRTDALRFVPGAGVKAGDEVITVPNTFIATTEP